MEDVIQVVNKLQDIFSLLGSDSVELPQIVVVGSQSSGKSSVIEAICHRDLLPRGSGIVTRRPLVLQLVHESEDSQQQKQLGERAAICHRDLLPRGSGIVTRRPLVLQLVHESEDSQQQKQLGERAVFLHLPDRVFTDFAEVRKEIERETDRLAGFNKGIVNNPIHLKVYSPNVLDLTLVDLPGITKIPVGDQPTDIEKLTRQLVLDYITNPNSLILAVSPANVDLVNSESLKLAREVDPEGKRTLGVITKIDLMDAGTNALDILAGRVYPLRLGFVGVVNRSQQDTVANKPISDALANEVKFFRSHPVYRTIANRCGTAHLTKTLNSLLLAHIRERLPDIKNKISSMISQTERELQSLGDEATSADVHKPSLFLRLLTQFTGDFTSSIEGNGNSEFATAELCGGARLYHIFNHVFGAALDSINPMANLSTKEIRTAIRNSTGPRASLFVPEIAFELLVKPQIKLLEAPGQRCVQLAYEELMRICHYSGTAGTELRRYPKLQARVVEVISDLLRECLTPTVDYVANLIAIERAYINTNHPDFIGGSGAIAELERKVEKKRRDATRARVLPSLTSDNAGEGIQDGLIPPSVSGLALGSGHSTVRVRTSSTASVSNQKQPRSTMPIPNRIRHADGLASSSTMNDGHGYAADGSSHSSPGSSGLVADGVIGSRFDELDITDRDELETQLIRSLISSYFNIVRKTVQDLVPKAIMHMLVNKVRDSAQNRLVEALYREKLMEDLLAEDENLTAERNKCKMLLEVYQKAFAVVAAA
ncbi:hypothetical protein GQ42DRAFT_147821 [Ramicandelaber brevisporus]|nr:hypothetical protein GQ42DRAFT_147821 [Ramicandelaber brevisporus]